MAGEEPLVGRVRQAEGSGDRFALSITVLGELYYAVYASQRRRENSRRLQVLVRGLRLWPFDEDAARMFGQIQAEQKVAGRPIPALDAQIAAVARTRGFILLTSDRHFGFVADLPVQDWRR